MMISKNQVANHEDDENIYEVFMMKLEKKGINILSKTNSKKMEREYQFINRFIKKLTCEEWY